MDKLSFPSTSQTSTRKPLKKSAVNNTKQKKNVWMQFFCPPLESPSHFPYISFCISTNATKWFLYVSLFFIRSRSLANEHVQCFHVKITYIICVEWNLYNSTCPFNSFPLNMKKHYVSCLIIGNMWVCTFSSFQQIRLTKYL